MLLAWVLSDSVVQDVINSSNSDQAIEYNCMFKPNAIISLAKTGVNRDFLWVTII